MKLSEYIKRLQEIQSEIEDGSDPEVAVCDWGENYSMPNTAYANRVAYFSNKQTVDTDNGREQIPAVLIGFE